MNISKANANKLGQLFAEALEHCNNPEQRAGVLKASDLIADEFSAKESDAGWKRYIAFREGFQQRFEGYESKILRAYERLGGRPYF